MIVICVTVLLWCSSSHIGYCRRVCSICWCCFDILCCWSNFVALCFIWVQHRYVAFNTRCQENITLPALHVTDFSVNTAICSAHFTNWAVKIAQSVNWCRPCTRNYFSCIHKLTKFAQFVNWANFQLPNSGNRQAVCQVHELGIGTGQFHELGNETVQFTKWAVSQIGRNTDTFYFAMKQQ